MNKAKQLGLKLSSIDAVNTGSDELETGSCCSAGELDDVAGSDDCGRGCCAELDCTGLELDITDLALTGSELDDTASDELSAVASSDEDDTSSTVSELVTSDEVGST